MDINEAHELYQQFQKVDAAAKQKQGLGFGAAAAPAVQQGKDATKAEGWTAPYKLSDKFQQSTASAGDKRDRDSNRHDKPRKSARDAESLSPRKARPSQDKYTSGSRHNVTYAARRASPKHKSSHHRQRGDERKADDHQHRRSSQRHDSSHHSKSRHSSSDSERANMHHSSSRHTTSDRQRHSSKRDADRHDQSGRHHQSDSHRDSSRHSDSHRHRDSSPHQSSRHKRRDSADKHHSSDRHADMRRRGEREHAQGKAVSPPDYSRLIVGYDDMTAAERLRAVTKYKLRKTSSKEKPTEDGKPWTRFVFNNDALLEEEGAVPSSLGADDSKPVGLGAFDFRQHRPAANVGDPSKSAEQAHEAAIFGMPAAMSEPKEPQTLAQTDETDEDAPQIVPEAELYFPAGATSSGQPQSAHRAELADTQSCRELIANLLQNGRHQEGGQDVGTPGEAKLTWREKAMLKKQQALQHATET